MADGGLSNKVVLISGGASGIGAATAAKLVNAGAHVMLADLQIDKGRNIAAQLGERADFVGLDVRDETQWAAAFAAAKSRFGRVTSLVNSAGVSIPGAIEDLSLDDFRLVVGINLDGTFLGCKHGVLNLKDVPGAAIVNVGSTLGVKSGSIFTAYSASKGGVRLLTRSVALYCCERGYDLRVNCLLPGAIHTEMVEAYVQQGEAAGATREQVIGGFAESHPMKRLGTPEEAAQAVAFLLSDASSFTTGTDLAVDGGFLA